jgi:hypothetical protein
VKFTVPSVLSVVCVAASITSAWAGPVGVARNLSPVERSIALDRLQIKQKHVGQQMPEPPKGPVMARWMDKRSQLQDLINRLQSGQPVSPDEIDQALQPTYQ